MKNNLVFKALSILSIVACAVCIVVCVVLFSSFQKSKATFPEELMYSVCQVNVVSGDNKQSNGTAFLIRDNYVATIIVNSFIPWYVASIHSTGDIITIFTGNYSVVSSYNYSDYSSNLSTRRQSIVCFWNVLTDGGSIDYFEGAHYIYTRKEQSYYVSYNNPYSGNGNNNNQFDYLYETFGVSNGTDASTKMMVAYVLQS